jgi:hypothetical protein
MREIISHLLKQTSELYSLFNNCGLRCNVLARVLLAYYAMKSGRNLLVFLTQLILSSSKPKMEAADSFETLATTSKIVHCTHRINVTCLFMCMHVLPKVCLRKKLGNESHLPYMLQNFEPLYYGCTNPRHQVAMETKLCTVVPNIYGSSVWNMLHFMFLVSRIMKWLLNFWKFCAPLLLLLLLLLLLHHHHHHRSVTLVIRLHVAQLSNTFIPSRENDYSLFQGILNGCKAYPAYYVTRPCCS